jgi:hypothetical protein
MRITKDYATHTKDDLLAEAGVRGITSVNSSSAKADIVAELELNDESNAPTPKPAKPSNLPAGLPAAIADIRLPGTPPADKDYSGSATQIGSGEKFAVCIVKDAEAVDGKTHFAKNTLHFWNGTPAEFREQFDK